MKRLQTTFKLGIKGKINKSSSKECYRKFKKKDRKKKQNKNKNGKFSGSGSPSRLGPLSRYNALPTELQILRLYVTTTVCIARNKWTKILSKICFDSNITLQQKLCCLI